MVKDGARVDYQKCLECIFKETCTKACTEESLLCEEQERLPGFEESNSLVDGRSGGITSEKFLATIQVEREGCQYR